MKPTRFSSLALLTLVGATVPLGCGGNASDAKGGTQPNPSLATSAVALRRTQNCDDLLQQLKEDAKAKINAQVDATIDNLSEQERRQRFGNTEWWWGNGSSDDAQVTTDSAKSSNTTMGSAASSTNATGSAASADGADKSASATSYSETNVQVKGVDEADIVKNDGEHLYVLRGREFFVMKAWPATDLTRTGSLVLEGQGQEMFVADGKAVIYSHVDGLPVYEATGTPLPAPYADSYAAYQQAKASAPANGANVYRPWIPLTKITVVALEGNEPRVVAEHYEEGVYASSRRVGQNIHTVLNYQQQGPGSRVFPTSEEWGTLGRAPQSGSPTVKIITAWEKARARLLANVDAATLDAWLPRSFTKTAERTAVDAPACDSYYVPPSASTMGGLVRVHWLDWNEPTRASSVSIVGSAQTVYANGASLYVAATRWDRPRSFRWFDAIPEGPSDFSAVHKFTLGGEGGPAYEASGAVPGTILNQFSLDEHNGFLRLATSEQRVVAGRAPSSSSSRSAPWHQERFNHVYALESSGGQLTVVGDVGDIAKEEAIYAVRFMGGKAYVVTFPQPSSNPTILAHDPLFALDVSNPRALRVLGELEISGFSNYMHPLDETHLLTIGQDADDRGRTLGLALQIFDVTDPTNPVRSHKVAFDPGQSGYAVSTAQFNAKAFTFFAEKGLLTFPLTASVPCNRPGESCLINRLELFSINATAGIKRIGSVDHSAFLRDLAEASGRCGGSSNYRWYQTYGEPTVHRGVFLENYLYSISDGGVLVNRVDDLAQVKSLPLPFSSEVYPTTNACSGPGSQGGTW